MFLKEIFGETVVCDKSSNLLVWECPVEVVLRNMGPLARHGVIAVTTGEVEAVVVTVAAPETHDKLNFTVTSHVSSTKCIYLNFQKPVMQNPVILSVPGVCDVTAQTLDDARVSRLEVGHSVKMPLAGFVVLTGGPNLITKEK